MRVLYGHACVCMSKFVHNINAILGEYIIMREAKLWQNSTILGTPNACQIMILRSLFYLLPLVRKPWNRWQPFFGCYFINKKSFNYLDSSYLKKISSAGWGKVDGIMQMRIGTRLNNQQIFLSQSHISGITNDENVLFWKTNCISSLWFTW